MILVLINFILLINYGHSNVEFCNDGPITSTVKSIGYPNCLKQEFLDLAKDGDTSAICEVCKDDFKKKYDSTKLKYSEYERKKDFIETAFKEYQKNIANNLIETTKLRALQPTGISFNKSITACKEKTLNDFALGCKSHSALKIIESENLLKKMNTNITSDLAKIISTDPNYSPKDTLLKRDHHSCFIPEKDILLITSSAIEETLAPFVDLLSDYNPQNFKHITELFNDEKFKSKYKGDIKQLSLIINHHPIIKEKFKSPESMITFLKSVPQPRNIENFRSTIYSKESGDDFDSKLAENCKNSFQSLKDAICKNEFEDGKITLDPFQNQNKILSRDITASDNDLSNSEELFQDNIEVLKRCEPFTTEGRVSLTDVNKSINSSLTHSYSQMPLNKFLTHKYRTELGNINKDLCENGNKPCSDTSFQCKLISDYQALSKSGSRINSLARSSNNEINNLLRSMIGNTNNIDTQTREILVSNGILPKLDGSIVAQPEVPERKPENYAKAIRQESHNTKQVAAISPAANPRRSSDTHEEKSSYDNHTSLTSPASSSSAFNDDTANLQDSIRKQKQEFQDVQDEIRRRLLGEPNKKPASMSKAREIASEAFASRGRKPTPEQLNSFAEQMMSPQSDFNTPSTAQTFTGSSSGDRSTVSGGKTKAEQFRETQKQQALMGMAGAQQSALNDSAGTKGAEPSKAKELAKINLNIAEDPKVTLSDIFAQKMQLNDNETQKLKELLKQNNNFVLQVKDMNFKVLFNEKNAFNLLLESGDKREAERIRPQLEIFLNKLKRNNTLHNLNQTWST